MERQFKGAIFDLDGTIVDSMGMWRSLDRRFVESQGKEYDAELSRAIVGMTLAQAAEYFNKTLELGKSTEQILAEWEDFLHDQYENHIPIKRSCDKLIEKWHQEGVKMCVATLTDKDMAEKILAKFGLLDKMIMVHTVEEAGKSKMHPDIYLNCAEKMGLKPSECVVLEDTCHAIETAKNAGFIVYAIDEDTAVKKEKIKSLCDRYIMDFKELL